MEPQKSVGSLEAGVTDYCKPSDVTWVLGLNLGPQGNQPELLTAESSLQPHTWPLGAFREGALPIPVDLTTYH